MVNGTAALHISLLLAGVRYNDEVILPSLTFAATANAIMYCGAIPHFVDSEEETLGIDPINLRQYLEEISEQDGGVTINKKTKRRISVILPVHVFGNPCKIDKIVDVARDFNLKVVEDAAESLGSTYKGKHTGTFGLLGAISFNGNKIITTGGGGVILTDDEKLAKQAKHLTTTAKVPHKWEYVHDQLGYNYRMPNLNAAVGCAQLEQLDSYLKFKRELFIEYKKIITGYNEIRLLEESKFAQSNYWLQTIIFENDINVEEVIETFNDNGMSCRPAWKPLHLLSYMLDFPREIMCVAESLNRRIINIPSMKK